jgi:hypothetical protein
MADLLGIAMLDLITLKYLQYCKHCGPLIDVSFLSPPVALPKFLFALPKDPQSALAKIKIQKNGNEGKKNLMARGNIGQL